MTYDWSNCYAERTKNSCGSQIRRYFALTERPEVVSFAGGFPGNDFFPCEEIAETLALLARKESRLSLQYGPTEGSYDLRCYLSKKMRMNGMDCGIANIMITDGSQQGLDLLGRILINPGDPVLVEEPSYVGGTGAIKSYGGIPVGIAMDKDGPLPAVMERTIENLLDSGLKPKIFYTVPNFQNPTGITTSLERRLEILDLASRYDLIIIEDNPYGDLCYEGRVPQHYSSLDSTNCTVYLGSYSKVLIPGIRIGWMVGAELLIEKVALAKQTANLCSSSLGQQLAFHLSNNGCLDRHIAQIKDQYRKKRDIMVESMQHYFPADIIYNQPRGGFFIWVDFPSNYPPSRKLLNLSLEENVAFIDGEAFCSNGGGSHSARFSFSQPDEGSIAGGIKTLGQLLDRISAGLHSAAAGGGAAL